MTSGSPWKSIIRFALPVLAGSLLQQLYNTVDAIIVGRYAGEASLSESIMTELEKVGAQVNAIRANSGLHPLTLSASLSSAAQVSAMECERAFSHTRPDGSAWWTVNSTIMYGENLAKNYYDSGSVVAAWMASPTHAANILGGFNTIGLGLHQTSNGTWYWAQEFGF